jgi:hypothetical protein
MEAKTSGRKNIGPLAMATGFDGEAKGSSGWSFVT